MNKDEDINESPSFINLVICGERDAGKCTLAKSLIQTNGSISNPNFFKIGNNNYFILRVPCFVDYEETLQIGTSLADIALILISATSHNESYCKIKLI